MEDTGRGPRGDCKAYGSITEVITELGRGRLRFGCLG